MSDSRFARLQTDPRFRRAKQKNLKVEIDDRFKDVLQSEEFGGTGLGSAKGRVDKRGRKLGSSHTADQLKHFYRLKSPEPGANAEAGGSEEKTFVDYARGEGNLDSSGSEDEESEVEEDELELGPRKAPAMAQFLKQAGSDDEEETDEDESGSEGSHLNINLSEDDDEVDASAVPSAFPPEDGEVGDEEEEEQYADPTKRIAAVNLDWDNLRAGDLFAVFNSFLKPTGRNGESSTNIGKLLSVKIYPSEFGKERLEREEREGPGADMFTSKKGDRERRKAKTTGLSRHNDEDDSEGDVEDEDGELDFEEIDEDEYENEVYEPSDDDDAAGGLNVKRGSADEEDDEGSEFDSDEDEAPRGKGSREIDDLEVISDVESNAGSDDIDMEKLREYQLQRLRYWYAIATFSTVEASMKVLSECNGAEFEKTANMFDLSYVPDEMEFDESDIKDEATKEPKAYKGNDFVTDALRHSKVKLTWDQDDPNRSKLTRRNLTKEEIEEEDFTAYLASSGSESEGSAADEKAKKAKKGKRADKKADKMRALLLKADDDDDGDVWGKAGLSNDHDTFGSKKDKNGEMEITFRPGLAAGADSKDEKDLTTLEKYQLRMKEKKARKKEKLELKRAAKEATADGDSDSDAGPSVKSKAKQAKDDFFGDDDDESDGGKDIDLDIPDTLPPDEDDSALHEDLAGAKMGADHFSMKDILKAEKEQGKKRRRNKKKKNEAMEREVELGKEGWKIDVQDPRFKVLHDEPEFAIDPSNPHFIKTKAMTDLLAERSRRKGDRQDRPPVDKKVVTSEPVPAEDGKDLGALVQSVKRKMGEGSKRVRKRSKK